MHLANREQTRRILEAGPKSRFPKCSVDVRAVLNILKGDGNLSVLWVFSVLKARGGGDEGNGSEPVGEDCRLDRKSTHRCPGLSALADGESIGDSLLFSPGGSAMAGAAGNR